MGADTTAIEVLGRTWFTAELVRAGIEVARPERDIGVDLLTYTSTWMLPIQLKTIGRNGITVHKKYIGQRIGVVYVFLSDDHGGSAGRQATTAHLLAPEEAWALPVVLGQSFGPDCTTFRFGTLTRALRDHLDASRVQRRHGLNG